MKKIKLLLIFIILPLSSLSAETAEDMFRHAQTYFWLGLNEQGDMFDYLRGIEYLDEAEKVLNQDQPVDAVLGRQIEALRSNITEQIDMTHDTLGGVFPRSKMLGLPVLIDPGVNGTYEIVDDAYIIALTSAVENSLPLVNASSNIKGQTGVIVFSMEDDIALENEALFILNRSQAFYGRPRDELLANFSEPEIEKMKRDLFTEDDWRRTAELTGDSHLAVLRLEKSDQADDVSFYTAHFTVFDGLSGRIIKKTTAMGFCRDRNRAAGFILLSNIILLAASIVFSILIKSARYGKPAGFPAKAVAAGTVFFILGRILPYILASLLSPLRPPPETLAVLSFWWPIAAGLVILFGPPFLYFSFSGRVGRSFPALSLAGGGGSAFLSLGCGITGYLALQFFTYEATAGLVMFIPFAVAAVSSLYLLGRVIDPKDETSTAYLAVSITGLSACAALFSFRTGTVYFTVTGSALLLSVIGVIVKNTGKARIFYDQPDVEEITGDADSELIRLITGKQDSSGFIQTPAFEEAACEFQAGAMFIHGPQGRGKSAWCRALTGRFIERGIAGRDPLVLYGACPDADEPRAYGLFEQVFSRHTALSALINTNDSLDRTASSLEELAGSLLPIPLEILFPEGLDNKQKTSSEIHEAIYSRLLRLAKERGLILILEDIELIDPDSKELLLLILEHLNSAENMIVIGSSKNEEIFKTLKSPQSPVVAVPFPDDEMIQRLLTEKFCFTENTAEILSASFKLQYGKSGETADLIRMLIFFAHQQLFVSGRDGYSLSSAYSSPADLPVAPDLLKEVKDKLDSVPEYERILGCAACIGREFLADTVAESLNMPRLELLTHLKKIEGNTGFIFDIRATDDFYAFSSPHILQVIRDELEINSDGDKDETVPQIVREYHRCLAQTLVRRYERSGTQDLLPEIARHFSAAGDSCAQETYDYALKTAKLSLSAFMYRQVFSFLDKAARMAEILPDRAAKITETLTIFLDTAHLSGLNRAEAAIKGLKRIKEHSSTENPLKLKIARACYEYAVSGKREYFSSVYEIAESVLTAAPTDVEKAEALQFMGLSANPGSPERKKHLQDSLSLLEEGSTERENRITTARVLDSLGREIMKDNPGKAEEYFNRSIEIKSSDEINDRPGLAITYGALGNLNHFIIGDLAKASGFYLRDLEIAEEVNDLTGQIKMHSLIAGCSEGMGKFTDALISYEKSFELCGKGNSSVDLFFALAGIVISTLNTDEDESARLNAVRRFRTILDNPAITGMLQPADGSPGFLRERLKEVIEVLKNFSSFEDTAVDWEEEYNI